MEKLTFIFFLLIDLSISKIYISVIAISANLSVNGIIFFLHFF